MFLGVPTIAWAFLAVSLIGAVFTANAFVPVRRVPVLFMPSFFGSWLTAELAIHHVFWQSIAALVFVELGALAAWPGWAGLIITFGSWLGLFVLFADGNRARQTFDTPRSATSRRCAKRRACHVDTSCCRFTRGAAASKSRATSCTGGLPAQC